MEFSVIIKNKQGIHLKPAAAIAKIAFDYPKTSIFIQKGDKIADAKSVISILSLELTYKSEIAFKLEGDDAKKCKTEIDKLISQKIL